MKNVCSHCRLLACQIVCRSLFLPCHRSSVHHQVSLVARETEEIRVSQGPLEWREPQDCLAFLDHQGQEDLPDFLDQELERESQDYQEEKVDCSSRLSSQLLTSNILMTEKTTLCFSCLRWERFPRAGGLPWTTWSFWNPRVSWRERTGWRAWKNRTSWQSWILWTERSGDTRITALHD